MLDDGDFLHVKIALVGVALYDHDRSKLHSNSNQGISVVDAHTSRSSEGVLVILSFLSKTLDLLPGVLLL